MIDSIIVKNMETLKSITLNKTSGSKFMLETDGINWGSAKANHNTITNRTGVGSIVTSSSIKDRTVSITGRICPVHNNTQMARLHDTSDRDEIVRFKEMEIEDGCAELSRLINPLAPIRIYIGKFYIEGKATSSLVISDKWKENNEIYKKFTFSLECADPMFYLKSKINTSLSGITGGFHFPLVITGTGMHFGIVQTYQLVVVENTSDVVTGAVIYMKATGTVINPSITNVYTQETILVKKTLSAGEIVRIDTNKRKIEGSTDGGVTFTSYLSYWDWDNSWFEFPVGSSLFGYSADEDSYDSLVVWIELQQSIYTLEDE